MTVRHLQGIHQGQNLSGTHAMEARFQAGFAECAREVTRFICNTDVEASLRSRLLGHLASCLASLPPPPTDAMDSEDGSGSSSRTAACPSSSAMNTSTTDATGSMPSLASSRLVIKQEVTDGDGCGSSPYGGVAVALPGGPAGHHHYQTCFSSGERLPLTTPLNLATGSRSSACSSSSSGVSAPASPFSDSESTTSAASDDNYGPEAIRMDVHTFGVIRRAPAAMFCDPVWRPW